MAMRPKFSPVSEEMRRFSVLLAEELLRWPGVSARPMFGMRAFYRGTVIFAILPETRSLDTPWAIGYKRAAAGSKREGRKWRLFELKNSKDIVGALVCLERAYRRALRSA